MSWPTVVPSRNVQASCPAPTISRYVAKSLTCTCMIRIPMASAGDKGFASRGQGRREDLGRFRPDLGGDALEVRVERFHELLVRRLGPRGPEVSKRLGAATAALLVMPEIQVRPSANRLRRHATTNLHGSDIRLTLLKVNAPARGGMAGMAPPLDFHWKRSWRGRALRWAVGVPLLFPPAGAGGNFAPLASPGPPLVDATVPTPARRRSPTAVGARETE